MNPKPKVNLDADHIGHLHCVINEYHNYILRSTDPESFAEMIDEGDRNDWLDTLYMIGNIQGRLLSDNIDTDDLELIEAWETELKELEDEDEEDEDNDFTLVVTANLPYDSIKQIPQITNRLRDSYKAIRPFSQMGITWLTEDPEDYDTIQLVAQILVSPEYVPAVTADVLKAFQKANLPVHDHWEDKA